MEFLVKFREGKRKRLIMMMKYGRRGSLLDAHTFVSPAHNYYSSDEYFSTRFLSVRGKYVQTSLVPVK